MVKIMEKESGKKLDKWDVAVSLSSGALTAGMDALWINDISLADAHTWGSKEINEFVMKVAKSKGLKGKDNDLAGAIKKLEDDFPMAGDLLTNDFGGGNHHHLRDFSHHPTPVGLICSIVMNFTGKGFGTDTTGAFKIYEIKGWKYPGFEEAIYCGTIQWFFHLISDVAGSSGTVRMGKEGTGVPGPLMSFLKEMSSIPGIRNIAGKYVDKNGKVTDNYEFATKCSKLFNGTLLGAHDENGKPILHEELRFDLRTELGIVHESIANKQYLPVAINEIIVSAFYSVRRFLLEIENRKIQSIDQLDEIDIRACLPWRNEAIRHMRMIATATFSTIDISVAGIKAAAKNKDNAQGFALDFMQGINYWGLGDLALASNSELMLGFEKMHAGFVATLDEQKKKVFDRVPNTEDIYDTAKLTASTTVSIAKIGTPIGFISASIGVYDQIKKAYKELDEAKVNRQTVEAECAERISVIQQYRQNMEQTVSDYLYDRMTVFISAFENMDRAITENDIEQFILGNSMIQKELSGQAVFNSFTEFDEMMLCDDAIKL